MKNGLFMRIEEMNQRGNGIMMDGTEILDEIRNFVQVLVCGTHSIVDLTGFIGFCVGMDDIRLFLFQ